MRKRAINSCKETTATMMEVQGDKIRGYGRQLNTYAHQLGHGQPDDASKRVRIEPGAIEKMVKKRQSPTACS